MKSVAKKLCALAVLAASMVSFAQEAEREQATQMQNALKNAARGGTYYGLHVGINEFINPGCSTLKGCVNDANNIYDAYTDSETGYCAKQNAYKMINSAATKSAIRAKFRAIASEAKAGDIVLYTQSSHGGSFEDSSGKYTKDAYLCAYDANYFDTEFAEDLLLFVEGVKVVIVLDTCHSEGMFRSVETGNQVWDFVYNVQELVIRSREAARTRGEVRGNASIGWISAATYDEYSWDDFDSDGNPGGAFTIALTDGWTTGKADSDSDGFLNFWELYEFARVHCTMSHAQYLGKDVLEGVVAAKMNGGIPILNKPDLQFQTYNGWPSAAFLSKASGNLTSTASFEEGDSIYLYSYFRNVGDADASQFVVLLEVIDENNKVLATADDFTTPLIVGQGGGFNGSAVPVLQGLSAGSYKLRITLDSGHVVDETNESESDNTQTIHFTVTKKAVPLPGAPTSLKVSAGGDKLTVSWNAVSGAVKYNVYRSTTSSKPSSPLDTVSAATAYSDGNVAIGTTYYYWVAAVNSEGKEGTAAGPKSGTIDISLSFDDSSTRQFDVNGGNGSVVVTANVNWSATVDKSWVRLGVQNGGAGKTTLRFSVDATGETSDRSATITVSAGGGAAQKTLAVSQKGIQANPALGKALDSTGLSFFTGGDSEWVDVSLDDTFATAGTYVRSGALAYGQTGWIETIVSGSGTLQFRYGVSGMAAGTFALIVDGSEVATFATILGQWKYGSYNITSSGSHRIRWEYRQNGNATLSGTSYAMLDDVSFGTVARARPAENVSASSGASGITLNWTLTGGDVSSFNVWRATSLKAAQREKIKTMSASGNGILDQFSCTDGTCQQGITYYYWIESVNASGSAVSEAVSVGVEPPNVKFFMTEWKLPAVVGTTSYDNTNLAYSANIQFYLKSDVSWISRSNPEWPISANANWKVYVTVEPNTGAEDRHGTLTATDADGNVLCVLPVVQSGMPRNPTPLTWYVDGVKGNDGNDGASWSSAKKTIQAAIDDALSGDEIVVADGTYSPFAVGKVDMTIKSVNGAMKTIVDGDGQSPVATVYGRSTKVIGFRLQNGGYTGMGGVVNGGTWCGCVLTGGSAYRGGGAYTATLNSCLIYGNSAENGGGTYSCTLNNCVVMDNSASKNGGGAYSGTSCNSVIWGNTANGEGVNWYGGTLQYTCTSPLPDEGKGNIASDPMVAISAVGVCSVESFSPCINAGFNGCVEYDFDLAGSPRIGNGVVDIGAIEDLTVAPASPAASIRAALTGSIKIDIQATSRATEYVVYRSISSSPCPGQAHATVNATANATTAYIDSDDVLPGVEYWYWIAAKNEAGESTAVLIGKGCRVPSLSLNGSPLQFSSDGGTLSVGITTDAGWVAFVRDDWASVSPSAGDGNGQIAVSAIRNEKMVSHDTILSVVAGFGTAHPVTNTLSIVQSAAPAPVYRASFHANGGQGDMGALDFQNDVKHTLPPCGFVRTGYTFEGWSLEPNGAIFYSDLQTIALHDDITLYACWRANKYGVEFFANYGGVERPIFQKFTYDIKQRLLENPYVYEGATFKGWALSPSGKVIYEDQDEVLNLSSEDGAQISLYAVWEFIGAAPPSWTPVAKEDTMIVYATVFDTSANAALEADGTRLGAFAANGECRGWAAIMDGPAGRLFQLSVGVESVTERGLLLKVWNPVTGEVTEIPERISCNSDKQIGTIANPHEFRIGVLELAVELKTGWNWISMPLAANDPGVDAVFSGCTFADNDVIKTANGSATYYGGKWYLSPSTFRMEPGVSYVVKKSASGTETVVFRGALSGGGVAVKSGWNWIAPTVLGPVEINSVSHSAGFAEDDIIKTSGDSATYSRGAWWLSSFTLKPGCGYKAKLSQAGTLTFGGLAAANASASAVRSSMMLMHADGDAVAKPGWTPVTQEDTMIAYLQVRNPAGGNFDATGTMLAAFTPGGECRGVAEIADGPGGIKIFQLSIGVANSEGTGFAFALQLWDAGSGKVYSINENAVCNAEKLVGKIYDPEILTVRVAPPVTYTVTFLANGGTGTMAAQTFTEGVPQALTKNTFAKTDCEFGGWKDQYGNEYDDAEEIAPTGNLTLTAQWKIVPRIAVSPEGREHGWHAGEGSFSVACNTGWTATADAVWIDIAAESGTGDGTVAYSILENTGLDARPGTITVTTADGTKYAEFTVTQRGWSENYVVTFLPGSDDAVLVDGADMPPQEFEDGIAQQLSRNEYERAGFVFEYWIDQNGVIYYDGQEVEVTSDLTLTAHWTQWVNVYAAVWPEQGGAKGSVAKSPKQDEVKLGTTVSLTAKPSNSKTVFAYWEDDEGNVLTSADGTHVGFAASLKVAPNVRFNNYWARFRLKSACKRPVFESGNPYGDGFESANSMVGVAYKAQIVVNEDAYPVKFSAKGLPPGLKINAATGVISGVPTKAGTFKPTITVKSAANSKLKASSVKLPITIAKLPAWARGTFNGRTFVPGAEFASGNTNGSVKVTVGAAGKISGKIALGGTNWTVSASSYSVDSDAEGETFVAKGTASVVAGKKTCKLPWRLELAAPGGEYNNASAEGTLGNVDEYGEYPATWMAVRDIWKDAGAKTLLVGRGTDQYGNWTGAYVWRTPDGEQITLTVATSGAVKAVGTLRNGRKISLSSTVVYADGEYDVILYAPPQTVAVKNKNGKVVSKVSYSAFFAEVRLVNEPGTLEAGGFTAYRKQGVRAAIDEDSTGTGSIKYSTSYGQAASNATVVVTATAAKKNVFAYWMLDGEIVSYSAAYKAKMGDGDFTGLTAVFRKTSDYKAKPTMPHVEDGDFDSMRVGIPFRAVVDVEPEFRPVKFTAKNLPAGLKLDATTGVISGVPAAAGAKTIAITATSVANTKLASPALKIPVSVSNLDTWAKGTFTGKGVLNGKIATATLTVGSTGKISGKFVVSKKAYAFSASSYSVYDGYYEAKAKLTYGKTTYPVVISVDLDGDSRKGFAYLDVMFNDDREGVFGTAEVWRK